MSLTKFQIYNFYDFLAIWKRSTGEEGNFLAPPLRMRIGCHFALANIWLNRYDSIFMFNLLLSGDINLKPQYVAKSCENA